MKIKKALTVVFASTLLAFAPLKQADASKVKPEKPLQEQFNKELAQTLDDFIRWQYLKRKALEQEDKKRQREELERIHEKLRLHRQLLKPPAPNVA